MWESTSFVLSYLKCWFIILNMKYIHRNIENELLNASRNFPAVFLTGPRRSGKTTLLRKLFPQAQYLLLEDPDLISRVRSDPKGVLEDITLPVILDEIQNTPELFGYIRTLIDRSPGRHGQWLFTGSQEAPLMRHITESMAGRVALFELWPLSHKEMPKVSPWTGGFPEVVNRPSIRPIWFRSYIQTYLERDVRQISAIKDLSAFRRFLAVLTSRTGQILNKTDLASPLGVSVPTITEWLNILEITGQILVVPPFYENFGKRLIKSPKVYFSDSGLACYFLGIESEKALRASTFAGSIFEGFIASELIKSQINRGKRKEIYYFRDQQGLEVDFIVPRGNGKLRLLEVKASRTPKPDMAASMLRLSEKIKAYKTELQLVYWPNSKTVSRFNVLKPGVKVVSIEGISDM